MGRQFCYGKEILFLQGSFSMEKGFFSVKEVLLWENISIRRRKFFRKKNSISRRKFYYGTSFITLFIMRRKFYNGKTFPLRKRKI